MQSLSKTLRTVRRINSTNPFAIRINEIKDGSRPLAVTFVMSKEIVSELRWMTGDRIDILWDKDQLTGQLVRLPANATVAGWKLRAGSSENAAFSVQVTLPQGIGFTVESKLKEHVVTQSTLLFELVKP